MTETDRICVGAIAGSYGTDGQARIKSFCAIAEDITSYGTLYSEDGKRTFEITLGRPIKAGFTAKIEGLHSKEEADALRGMALFADRAAMPSLPDDEYYHADLISLEVFDTGGKSLGRVKAVQNHGAADLLEIHAPGQSNTVLLPFTRAAVPTVDLASGRIIADPPEGLFEES